MSEGTETNINRKIEQITVWMGELDLHISGRENLASIQLAIRRIQRLPLFKTC
jgi:hypothetical protein